MREWIMPVSFAVAVAGYLWWLYENTKDSKMRMKDHVYMMDLFKAQEMERRFNESN